MGGRGAGGVPSGQHGQELARVSSDAARGPRDFKAPWVAPGLGVRDLRKAHGNGMRSGGPGRRGQAQRNTARVARATSRRTLGSGANVSS
jgi:hypothetical protein